MAHPGKGEQLIAERGVLGVAYAGECEGDVPLVKAVGDRQHAAQRRALEEPALSGTGSFMATRSTGRPLKRSTMARADFSSP